MKNNKIYETLVSYKEKYPELTFNNKGYQYLSQEIKEKYKEQIEEIASILKECIQGFIEFNNFIDREDGSFSIRCQHYWDEKFRGVGYFNIEVFKDLEE